MSAGSTGGGWTAYGRRRTMARSRGTHGTPSTSRMTERSVEPIANTTARRAAASRGMTPQPRSVRRAKGPKTAGQDHRGRPRPGGLMRKTTHALRTCPTTSGVCWASASRRTREPNRMRTAQLCAGPAPPPATLPRARAHGVRLGISRPRSSGTTTAPRQNACPTRASRSWKRRGEPIRARCPVCLRASGGPAAAAQTSRSTSASMAPAPGGAPPTTGCTTLLAFARACT